MQNRIEPPVLLSKLLIFVVAAALVVLVTLVVTMTKMIPIDQSQVFFLLSRPQKDTVITVKNISKGTDFLEGFVARYITERNAIEPDLEIMQKRWNPKDGHVVSKSTGEVFNNFIQNTDLWYMMFDDEFPWKPEEIFIKCSVAFKHNTIVPQSRTKNGDYVYIVDFVHTCDLNQYDKEPLHVQVQDKKVRITLSGVSDERRTEWSKHSTNPLGIIVSGYEVLDTEPNILQVVYDKILEDNTSNTLQPMYDVL